MEDNRREARRREDIERDELLRERKEQIDRLADRVQALLTDRVTVAQFTAVQSNQAQLNGSLQRLEIALFGATGDNGINSAIKDIQSSIHALHEAHLDGLTAKLTQFRTWALGIITTLALIGGGIIAAVISAQH